MLKMATSESDDFESADEELTCGNVETKNTVRKQQWSPPVTIGSDSDDDTEFIPRPQRDKPNYKNAVDKSELPKKTVIIRSELLDSKSKSDSGHGSATESVLDIATEIRNTEKAMRQSNLSVDKEFNSDKPNDATTELASGNQYKCRSQRIPKDPKIPTNKKLGASIISEQPKSSITAISAVNKKPISETLNKTIQRKDSLDHINPEVIDKTLKDFEKEKRIKMKERNKDEKELDESEIPEELKSDKTFKEIFETDGWEDIDNDIELADELTEEKLQTLSKETSIKSQKASNFPDGTSAISSPTANEASEHSSGGWSSWGMWSVNSLINTATAGVSTITSHVSQGLSLLEESIGVPDPVELIRQDQAKEENESNIEKEPLAEEAKEESQSSFGFGSLLSEVTKLVETTGSKVVTGGLDTLEAIGKKTMEVLQEGDPGLKKKRAFFLNEGDKPILSQVLREAKEKADKAEKTIEEKKAARRVHFESIFDDYQGLVHLEALEMLSKQSNIKIQQHLSNLESDDLISCQETLDEVKELCDLGDDDDEEENVDNVNNLQVKLTDACKDLGVNISYEKLYKVWEECKDFLESSDRPELEVYERAICSLAQFTAFSVERFHKTAELILIKERRSTVNEADSLVQLVRILSSHIGTLANCFCKWLNQYAENSGKSSDISSHITTIFLEAANASSYVQDAFRLLIPIIQVGAI
ncbi:protein FAM114A2 [Prorops nasuta]|uniref:protein FAM114A2 n=1 Tax=Prorops nasuta TaxID=863751 RepID=UPI0034CF6731